MRTNRHFSPALTTLFTLICSTLTVPIMAQEYSATEPQVTYSAVTELPTGTPLDSFSYGDSPHQFAELWLPREATPENPVPVVAFVHGGCWLSAYDSKHTHALATALTQRGYAVWSIEYRRTGETGGGWPYSMLDVQAGLRALQAAAPAELDRSKVVLAGHSAGGHLALLAAQETELNLQAVIGLAAITDMAAYGAGDSGCEQAATSFMGGDPAQLPVEYMVASPSQHPAVDNTILLYSEADTIVPVAQANALPEARKMAIPAAGHFDFVHPGTPAFEQFVSLLNEVLND
ncbi:MAG TPA: alpha/beta hydrolase [Pseudidiomarina sp.]|nr:alpha/beta hydrolase [Pseudidiomarina sp.]